LHKKPKKPEKKQTNKQTEDPQNELKLPAESCEQNGAETKGKGKSRLWTAAKCDILFRLLLSF